MPRFPGDTNFQTILFNQIILIYFTGVYTDVSMYKEWIDEIMSSEKLPDYDFSPFPNPTERIVGTGNSERLKNTALIILLPSMFHCIMAFW